ncbi:MAG: TM2 domain-containing protein [Clostridium sp.]|nr:TM2 domain-containing protein [Clostridium sp.]
MSNTTCPQCGAPLEAGATECKYCGEKIAQDQAYQNTSYQQQQQHVYQQPVVNVNTQYDAGINPAWPIKSKIAAGLLAIFLGGLGIHKFYLGKVGLGILYLVFCWTYIPSIIGFIEGIIYLCSSDHNFQVKNQVRLS